MSQSERQIEALRPGVVPHQFIKGWEDHRAGYARTIFSTGNADPATRAYLAGWDARHRLSCAAAAGRLLP